MARIALRLQDLPFLAQMQPTYVALLVWAYGATRVYDEPRAQSLTCLVCVVSVAEWLQARSSRTLAGLLCLACFLILILIPNS